MYQSCNRRLIPSMANSSLLSPGATARPCFLHCKFATDSGLYPCSALDFESQYGSFAASRISSGRGGNCFKLGFTLSPRDCAADTCYCARCRKDSCFCCRDGVRRDSHCFGFCTGSASMASPLLSPVGRFLKVRTLTGSSACSLIGRRGDQNRVQALSTSVSSKQKESASSPTIVQPSVTWGIIPHPPESSQVVLDFLESEGIDTMELRDVELPTSIEVMRERLDFLKKLGLSMETINSYPLMVTCSIKKNLVPVLDYLEQVGLRSKDLPGFLEKYPMVLHSSVVIDLMPVVDYLLGLDIQRKDISRVLARFPDVLGFRLEGTMSTSVAYLVSIGVRMRCIGRMLTEYPEILGMRVANNIKPKVDFLVSYGIPKNVVAKILEVRPYILGFDFSETMQSVVNDLLEAGVRKEAISAIVTQYPDILGQSIKENLNQKTKWLVQQVKVESNDVPSIIEKLPQVLFIKEGLAMERVRYFLNAGCSADDVAKMVRGCPQILALSIGQVIEPSLNFLLYDMKRSIKEVVKFPTYFTYDLKSRIMPRYKLIAEKGVDCSLEWFLNCTDQRFNVRLSADYLDDEGPGPVFQMGGVVFMETEQVEEVASTEEDTVPGINQQARHQAAKNKQPRLSHGRARQAVKVQHQRRDNEFETASDTDFEGFLGDEDELGVLESASDYDDSEEIEEEGDEHGNDYEDEELDMTDTASEFEASEDDDDDDDDWDEEEEDRATKRDYR